MPEDRYDHLATRDDAIETPAAPRADPLSTHTHVQHSCHPVRSRPIEKVHTVPTVTSFVAYSSQEMGATGTADPLLSKAPGTGMTQEPLIELDRLTGISEEVRAAVIRANSTFDALRTQFEELEASDKRLLSVPGMGIPTLNVSYELATVHLLRAIELAKGAAAAISSNNQVAAFPLLRSLVETWLALAYATIRFEALVVNGERWAKYDEIAMRLLLGTTSSGDHEVVQIGQMLTTVKEAVTDEDEKEGALWREFLEEWYGRLSDGTHPTEWSVTYHSEPREDGLGIHWKSEPDREGLDSLVGDLDMALELVYRQLSELFSVADQMRARYRDGPYRDEAQRELAMEYLRRIADSSRPDFLTPEAHAVAVERARLLLPFLEGQNTDGSPGSIAP